MRNKNTIKKLKGANMDIDLCTEKGDIIWEQETCPWNKKDKSNKHKCAVKNTSICPYFRGIKYIDTVLCSYPNKDKNE